MKTAAEEFRLALNRVTEGFIPEAVEHYEKTAPTVAAHCDDLYIRLTTKQEPKNYPTVAELHAVLQLAEGSDWIPPNLAANHIYHLRHRLGMDVTGQAGF